MSSSVALPPPVPRPKKRRRLWPWAVAVLLLAAGGGAFLAAHRGDPPVVVTLEPAVVTTITQLVSATGKIQPEVEVKIAPQVGGEIVALPVREGAQVKKGELILKIKPDNYQFQVAQQEASLASARAVSQDSKAKLDKAADDLKRDTDLHNKKLLNDSDFATAQTTLQSAQAGYESALANIKGMEGQLSQSRVLLEETTIFSPIDGTVSSLSNELGETVAGTGQYGGAEVMRVADLTSMELRVNINENDIVNVKPGDHARVSIDAFPKRKFAGIVKDIAASAQTTGTGTQDEVTNFLVKIRILDKDAPLKPGMSASADVETQTATNVVAVPIQSVTVRSRDTARTMDQAAADRAALALKNQGDGAATAVSAKQQKEQEQADREAFERVVFVYAGGKVRQVPVETGIADATHFEIKSGVKAGDQVVSGSYAAIMRTLKDGMVVTLGPAAAPADKK
jgi:HlyD family secretion protein